MPLFQALASRGGLAACFLALSLPLCLLIAALTPPFQNPDEIAHVLRADQVSRGQLLGARVECAAAAEPALCRLSDDVAFGVAPGRPEIGGLVDPGWLRLAALYRHLPFHPDRTVTRGLGAAARAVRFTRTPHPASFINTVVYHPVLYAPAAAALVVARAARLTPFAALRLARMANVAVTLGLMALALGLCARGARSVAVLLVLPMSLALSASVAPDGLMLAAAALAGAVLARGRPLSWRALGLVFALLVLLGWGRPPYAALGLLLVAAPVATPCGAAWAWRSLALRLGVAVAAGLAVLAWLAIAAPLVTPIVQGGARPDMAAQLAVLAADAWRGPVLLWRTYATVWRDLVGQAVGVLGWLDTPLPLRLHLAAGVALLLALIADAGAEDRRPGPPLAAIGLAIGGLVLVAIGLALALYLSFTPPGHPLVVGLQGRYFLPPAILALAFLPRLLPRLPGAGVLACAGLLGFGLLAAVDVPMALAQRFGIAP